MAEKEEEQTGERGEPALPEFNQVSIAGKLKDVPRISKPGTDRHRAQFSLRITRASRNADGKTYFDDIIVVGWRAIAKQCEGLAKGDVVRVQGCLRTWNSEKGFRWNVEADTIEVIERQASKQQELVEA